ncbi:MAG: glucosaminidase domain-containing protein [Romboutsia sp.]
MRKSTWKSIVSLALVIFLLIPNISTAAVEINNFVNTPVEEIIEESQTEVNSPGEVDNEGDVVNPSGENMDEFEEPSEVIPENETDENSVINAVEDAAKNTAENKTRNIESKSGETYEVTQKPQTYSNGNSAINPYDYEREDVRERLEAISEFEYLIPKTDSNYEVAMAHSDGTYSYVESVDTIEEAIIQVQNAPLPISEEEVLPVVVNNEGQVVYSTNSMLRILSNSGTTINLYTDSSLTNAFTYISQDYVEDAPIIVDNGKSAKIEIAGFTGWIDKGTSSQVIPVNQSVNPSYYISEGGVLKHFISYDLRGTRGTKLTLGPAPSYLREGVKYLSYDGNYFYDGSNVANGLNSLISDLKNGHHNNSVNGANPYYLYFEYLPFRSTSGYSAAELNSFINNNTDGASKLRGIGQALIDAQNTYGVNAVLALGVAINESAWGMSPISQSKNNLFGINAVDSSPGLSADTYATPGDSVLEFAKNLISRGYSDPADWRYQGGFLGNKHRGANIKYASDPFWGEKAAQWAHDVDFELSGRKLGNLRDQDAHQLAIYKSNNQVKNASGTLLYNITNDPKQYSGYYDTTLVITNPNPVYINGANSYEMYAERNTPVNNGGDGNKYQGNYNWNDKGYVKTDGITFINSKSGTSPNPNPGYKNQWIQESNGKWYYYNSSGNLHTGWLGYNGNWFYLYNDGSMATGWLELDGTWYYLYRDGIMAKGWLDLNGTWYYLYRDGTMAKGWLDLNGTWYYLYRDGIMAKGWLDLNGTWYYLYRDGTMATGWEKINNSWYYMWSDGSMAKGWIKDKNTWYYMYSNGIMATNTTIDGWIINGSGVGRPR